MNNSKEVINLIMKLAKEKKLSMSRLAEKVGVAKSTLSRYKNGEREFPINDIGKYAEVLGVSIEYLLGLEDNDGVEFDYYDTHVSAGIPEMAEPVSEYNTKKVSIPKHIAGKLSKDKNIKCVKLNGESMNNIIPNGSLIGFKPINLANLKNGDIVLFNDDYDYSVKRFYNDKENERFIFKPDSSDMSFTDYIVEYENAGNLIIEGKVVMYLVDLD